MKWLDKEEKEVMESFERGEWIPIKDMEQEVQKLRQVAKNTVKKGKRINIRISEQDLMALRSKAMQLGIPYQTLVSSIIHRYLRGDLVAKDRI